MLQSRVGGGRGLTVAGDGVDIPLLVVAAYLDVDAESLSANLITNLYLYSKDNIRSLLVLCNRVFSLRSGDLITAEEPDIRTAFEEISNILDPEALRDEVADALRELGMAFEPDVDVGGRAWRADFCIPRIRAPQILITIVSSESGDEEARSLRQLIGGITVILEHFFSRTHPRVVVVLTGYVSSKVIDEVRRAGLFAIDATDRSFKSELRSVLQALTSPAGSKDVRADVPTSLSNLWATEADRSEVASRTESRLENIPTRTFEQKVTLGTTSGTDWTLSPESVLPDRYSRFKYVGNISKVFAGLSVAVFLLALYSVTIYPGAGTFELRGPFYSLFGVGAQRAFPFVLGFGVYSFVLVFLDWKLVQNVLDRLMAERRLALFRAVDLYTIYSEEQRAIGALARSSVLVTFIRRSFLYRQLDEIYESRLGSDE